MKSDKKVSRQQAMKLILALFKEKVFLKNPNTKRYNSKHSGKKGHWLEKQFGLKHNGKNAPDIHDFEMKSDTTSKTTFGDWSPEYWIFNSKNNSNSTMTRNDFFKYFGKPNKKKRNRPSWSGEPFPQVGSWNQFGQKLELDKNENIIAVYSYKKDMRSNKAQIIPTHLQIGKIILAKWCNTCLKTKVENKFSKFGWFKCFQGKHGCYSHIVFGEPITYKFFIKNFLEGHIYIDGGMYKGNNRPYMSWRADNSFWDMMAKVKKIKD